MKKIFTLGIFLSVASIAFAQSGNSSGKAKAGQAIAPAPAMIAPTPVTAVKNTTAIRMPSPSEIVRVTDPAFKKKTVTAISPAKKKE
ncbi:MAG: hypothetical protein ACJ77K_12155 [Bacteroidia bacterium]